MAFVPVQVVVQRIIQVGLRDLIANPDRLDSIFGTYNNLIMASDYGQDYIDGIKSWLTSTKIRVVQAWSYNPQSMPLISIHLSSEQEDERSAAIGDYFAPDDDEGGDLGVASMSTTLDIGLHGTKQSEEVLWLYYITMYILFRYKQVFESFGITLHTFNASDYNRDSSKLGDNIWQRWIKFRATVVHIWDAHDPIEIDKIDWNLSFDNKEEN